MRPPHMSQDLTPQPDPQWAPDTGLFSVVVGEEGYGSDIKARRSSGSTLANGQCPQPCASGSEQLPRSQTGCLDHHFLSWKIK